MIKKTNEGKWLVDVQPGGRVGKRIKRLFSTLAEAKRFEHHTQASAIHQPWNPKPKDSRKLSLLILRWYDLHGQHLKAGKNTKSRLLHFCIQVDDPVASQFSAKIFADWRTKATTREKRPMAANGVNRVHSYVRAMFSTLIELKEWDGVNPLENVSQLRKPASELKYLDTDEIKRLLDALLASLNESVYPCAVLAMATGARWSEAESIEIRQVVSGAVRYHTSKNNDGGKWRTVPVCKELEAMLRQRHQMHGDKKLFGSCYAAFREAVTRAKIVLPKGQLTHVLRHTFATSFLSKGGDLRTLKEILGHETIEMTMKYAHLVEAHLVQARQFNPLAGLSPSEFCWNSIRLSPENPG